ncbi:uncharacterized protein CCOS01_06949 [Colletotrichum costaricense]|uniref:F-box domain-containing protein n=2 Tax=Colletotrichum acutatum species complex TaxID=2707335 RepID=A0AAI9YZD8_9PEZI|nr:uncharacterized protein CCOS01_06949 [Colletotrichum costaricense]XP_060388071.1 uncharacterized protein CTAM01_01568 [Colletotrichum tamarilloi]KAK1510995.1 hypothetical protein CTAM01_01568 [Colletotrichum tamarilloi]KAK1529115.1 hypothetical protein CCOS01_06949 [Colletotrichum costaricense]
MADEPSTRPRNPLWKRAIAFESRCVNKLMGPKQQSTKAYLLRISIELLEEIISYLDLLSQFMLSRTCRAGRILTQKDWKDASLALPASEQISFWAAVAYKLPNHWVCARCCALHATDRSDTPRSQQSPPCQQGETLDTLGRSYKLRHTHIELALKFRRMGTNTAYFSELLEPCEYRTYRGAESWKSGSPNVTIHIPRIVEGRFCLQVIKEFHGYEALHEIRSFRICRHQLFPWWYWGIKDWGVFEKNMEAAWHHPGNVYDGHCQCCPVDYSILRDDDVLRVTLWYDFGTGKSPRDLEWMVHLGDETDIYSNGLYVNVKDHEPGSIRKSFQQSSFNHMLRDLLRGMTLNSRKLCRTAREVMMEQKLV